MEKINLDPQKVASQAFKSGWDKAGREGAVSPELAKGLVEGFGIHPDRVQNFMDAKMAHQGGRGPKPDPNDFKTPVVTPFKAPQRSI